MVQKEVADRMQGRDRDPKITALCLWQYSIMQARILWQMYRQTVLYPRPKCGSAVIRLTRYKEPPVQVNDPKLMFKLIRASFNQRRKTLQNGLNNSPEISFSRRRSQKAIEPGEFLPSVRGEGTEPGAVLAAGNYFVYSGKFPLEFP